MATPNISASMIPVPRAHPVQYLEPREILLLDYSQGFSTTQEHHKFWEHKYNINVPTRLRHLVDRGFLRIGDRSLTLHGRTARELKEALRAHGMRVSGRKAELVDRLLANVPETDIDKVFPERRYALTDLGKVAVSENEYLGYVHSDRIPGLDIDTMAAMVNESPQRPWRDLIWGYLNHLLMTLASRGEWGPYRNVTFAMAEFVAEESRWIDALGLLTDVIGLDLNLLDAEELLPEAADFIAPYQTSILRIPPGILERARDWATQAGLNDDALIALMIERLRGTQRSFRVFTIKEATQVLTWELQGNVEALTELYARVSSRICSS